MLLSERYRLLTKLYFEVVEWCDKTGLYNKPEFCSYKSGNVLVKVWSAYTVPGIEIYPYSFEGKFGTDIRRIAFILDGNFFMVQHTEDSFKIEKPNSEEDFKRAILAALIDNQLREEL